MNNNISSTSALKVIGCIIFDFALMLLFFKTLGLFFIIAPIKSLLVLLILFIGLMIFNAALILPSKSFNKIGTPYSDSIIVLFILYPLIANIFSVYLMAGSTIRYIAWELILFGIFIFIFSIIMSFSKISVEDKRKDKNESIERNLVKLKLVEIESILEEKEDKDELLPIINEFEMLKERIEASTPFGRITDNNEVLHLENQINENLSSLIEMLKTDLIDNDPIELKKIMGKTKNLIINREGINIK